ncbi:radical SAM protein [Fusobacterium animalis]|uniref:radical SAM protein n=1 Tax=Fusobacterium animalis TaxID=76859 RepID=UPI0035699C70
MCQDNFLEIDGTKTYILKNFSIEKYESKYIVIKKNKWIVLENDSQKEIFNLLSMSKKIEDIFKNFEEEDILNVLTQIEAKKFEIEEMNDEERTKGAYIYLTNECNLTCSHCYMNSGKKNKNELTTEEIKKLLLALNKKMYTHITFIGGEVFLKKEFDSILKFSKKLGLKNIVLTNGTLATKKMISELAPFIDEVQVSIDGYDEKTNSEIRGKGNFNLAKQAVENFLENGVKTVIAITPQYENLSEKLDGYKKFSKDLLEKFEKNFKIKFSLELLDGRDFKSDIDKNKKYNFQLSRLIDEIYPNEKINNFALNYENGGYIINCGYGELTFSSNGDIFMCSLIEKIDKINNVRNINFDLSEVEDLTKKVKDNTSSLNIKPCKNCSLKYICGGGCRIKYLSSLETTKILNCEELIRKKCTIETKNYFYKLMIESNEYLFS